MVIQVFAPTSNAKEAEVELAGLAGLHRTNTPQNVLFIIGD